MKKVIAVLCICGLMGLTAGLPLSRAAAEEKTETQNGNISASDQVTYPEYCRNTGSVPSNPGEKLLLYAGPTVQKLQAIIFLWKIPPSKKAERLFGGYRLKRILPCFGGLMYLKGRVIASKYATAPLKATAA